MSSQSSDCDSIPATTVVYSRGREGKPLMKKSVVKINNEHVGLFVGRGGANIRRMEDKTGIKITVDKKSKDGLQTEVVLYGPPAGVEKAMEMIEGKPQEIKKPLVFDPKIHKIGPEGQIEIDYKKVNEIYDMNEKKKWAQIPTPIKVFYQEHPKVAALTPSQVSEIRDLKKISQVKTSSNQEMPNPISSFKEAFGPFPELLELIEQQEFKEPTPIQSQGWPILLSGHDLIGIAQTGTGKTLTYLLPAMIHVSAQKERVKIGPIAMILAPTRELAIQIYEEACKYSYKGIKMACLYGGTSRKDQIAKVEGVDILIATPGRLNDLVQAGFVYTRHVSFLVLDEADRMLDMGFWPQVRKGLIEIHPETQTVLTSATWPSSVQYLSKSFTKDPIHVKVGGDDLRVVDTINQVIMIVEETEKIGKLFEVMDTLPPEEKVIIFVGRKAAADHIASELSLKLIPSECFHGNKEQEDREEALNDLKEGRIRFLIATDVASRGLDIQDVTTVINFQFPKHLEEYVHRVGRTGRAGRRGRAISFFSWSDRSIAPQLIGLLKKSNQEVPKELERLAERAARNPRKPRTLNFKSNFF